MVLIKMAMDIGVSVEMIVTVQLRRSRDHFNRIYHLVFKNNNMIVILVDSVDLLDLVVEVAMVAVVVAEVVVAAVVYQAIIHLVGTILPAIIIRMIKKTSLSANHTKRVTVHTLKTATSNNSWAPHRKYDDIHPMK